MIFVTVGNATQPFDRLLLGIENLIKKGEIPSDSVVFQIGHNPKIQQTTCRNAPFFTLPEFEELICDAELVVTHAGAGTLMHLFRLGKIPVVMPRRKKYSEHVDDHQFEFVQALASEGRVIPAYEPEDLPEAIKKVKEEMGKSRAEPRTLALQLIGNTIEELIGKP